MPLLPVCVRLKSLVGVRASFIPRTTTTAEGPIPNSNYVEEVQHPTRTVRRYEWRGVLNRIRTLDSGNPADEMARLRVRNGWTRRGTCAPQAVDAVGFEQGWCVELLKRDDGTPTIDEADFEAERRAVRHRERHRGDRTYAGPCRRVVRSIRRLLKPGGLLFMTTGNAEPFHDRFTSWRYVTPEVHISYFEPSTLAACPRSGRVRAHLSGIRPRMGGHHSLQAPHDPQAEMVESP